VNSSTAVARNRIELGRWCCGPAGAAAGPAAGRAPPPTGGQVARPPVGLGASSGSRSSAARSAAARCPRRSRSGSGGAGSGWPRSLTTATRRAACGPSRGGLSGRSIGPAAAAAARTARREHSIWASAVVRTPATQRIVRDEHLDHPVDVRARRQQADRIGPPTYRPGGVRTSAGRHPHADEVGGPSRSTGTTTSRQPRSAWTISASRVQRGPGVLVDLGDVGVRQRLPGLLCLARSSSVSSRSAAAGAGPVAAGCRGRRRRVGMPAGSGSSGRRAAAASGPAPRPAAPQVLGGLARVGEPRLQPGTSVSASATTAGLTSACGTSAIRPRRCR
jgi:hypothetical protein